jgi:hypothetical protein
MDPATILFGIAAAGLKAVKVKDAAAGIEPAGGGVASDIGAALFTVLFSHHATEGIKRLRERFVKWVKGPAPEKNQDLERALARCQILADLLCLMEATPWGIEGEHDSWLRRVAGRLPPSLNAGGTQGAGFFKAADEGQIRSAKRA